ncbi:hypothetical protein C438_05452 [Haloferax denitrificans ATCC 35960]|uniref:DUF8025 domain-containing protein n=1 Tax=Haloferax denitrificans ATCC 35960 TaxID=662478 RepID=M0JF44_9EURY|nr:hypothetical protein C438_05452 [Haloferax denitrificans ATCC 35960]
MNQEATDNLFHDCELDFEAILGTHTFEDVLFTDDTETSVNVLTGETPAHSQATVEEATEFAASIDTETPQIALLASAETQIEAQSKPYTSAAFFHFKPTGSLKRHRAYHTAYDSDAYTVDFEADYESGDLTITVERAGESRELTAMMCAGRSIDVRRRVGVNSRLRRVTSLAARLTNKVDVDGLRCWLTRVGL